MFQTVNRKLAMLIAGAMLVTIAVTGCAGTPAGASIPVQQGGNLPSNTITVSGIGDANGTPDVAYVMLGVSVVNTDVGQAVTDSNTAMQQIKDAILALGVAEADLQTTNFNVWPEDRYDQTGQSTGERVYHVDSSLNVTVRDLAQTSQVIEAGLNAGANSVGGLSFGIDDTTALEAQARTAAIENARSRAQQLAETLGVELGEPIIVSETYGASPVYFPAERGAGMGGAGAPPISAGQLSVSVQVQVTFSTR